MTAAGATILLVDDDAEILVSLSRTLAPIGARIVTTTEPGEVLGLIATEAVDVLISDIDMGEVSGLDLIQNVRAWFPEVVRILLTGQTSAAVAIKAINSGEVFRYFTKPWDPREIREAIAQAVERQQELRKHGSASRVVERRKQLVADLEHEYPGISSVRRVAGAYAVEENIPKAIVAHVLGKFTETEPLPRGFTTKS